jgi:hypothetical protein
MKKLFPLLFVLAFFLVRPAHAIDSGDTVFHLTEAWNQDLKVFQTRVEAAHSFWDDFSVGPVFEFNRFFYAPGLGVTWHLEPFELLAHIGPLFWHKDGVKRLALQVSIHANYMLQITTHFQVLVTAGVNLPDKYFRGVPLGAGIRYWF